MSTVLLIDDNPEMRNVLATVLEMDGYDVLMAENGEEALAILHHTTPTIIISDVRMPHMDGITLLHTVRSQPQWAHIPVIFVSGNQDDHQIMLNSGANALLIKPFAIEKFNAVVREFAAPGA